MDTITEALEDKLAAGTPSGLLPTECWPWMGLLGSTGHGVVRVLAKDYSAQKLTYERDTGSLVPDGLRVLHTCPTKVCVNPAHLRLRSEDRKACSVTGCLQSMQAKGLCNHHYHRQRKYGDPLGGPVRHTVCIVDGCPVDRGLAKGYCSVHYGRLRNHGDPLAVPKKRANSRETTLADRLSEYTPAGVGVGECWEWTGSRNRKGYGIVTYQRKNLSAHREAYKLASCGGIPTGRVIRHKCDNPPCVNPAHLEIGTPLDNTNDMITRGRDRKAVGSATGRAKLTEDEVLRIRSQHADGVSGVALAEEFGVSSGTVYAILRRRTWMHI